MARLKGSHNKVTAKPPTLAFSAEERVALLATLIVDKIKHELEGM